MLNKNQIFRTGIVDLTNLGSGVAKIGGMTVFVDGTVPGDECQVRIIKTAKTYAVARLEKLITPSPDRVDPLCACAVSCGGCAYRCLSREKELSIKREYVKSAFRKAGIPDAEVEEVLAPTSPDRYRNKVQYPVGENGEIGYYARHTHRIVPCGDCLLQSEVFTPILDDLRVFLTENGIRTVKHLYLRVGKGTGQIMVCLVVSKRDFPWGEKLVSMLRERHPSVVSVLLNLNPEDTNVILGEENILLYGDGYIEDVLCGLRFRFSPLSFCQVNHDAAEVLYEQAFLRAARSAPKTLADLYCGAGTIGLYFASRMPGMRLKGVEIVPDAVKNAEYNARLNGIGNASFLCADSVAAEVEGMDVVVVDPPRKGCSEEVLSKIAECGVKHLVYISCGVDTLARDAAYLLARGYKMGKVTPVDLFPRTGSIECVTDFERIEE